MTLPTICLYPQSGSDVQNCTQQNNFTVWCSDCSLLCNRKRLKFRFCIGNKTLVTVCAILSLSLSLRLPKCHVSLSIYFFLCFHSECSNDVDDEAAVVNNAQTNFYRDCRKLERVLNCIPETLGLGERETERVHRVQLHNLSLILKAGEDKFLLIGSHLSSYRGSHPDERSDITPWNFVLKFFRFHGHNFSLALWPSWFAELVFYFILGMWHCLSASATTDVDDSLLILFHLRVLVLYTLRLMIRFNLYYYRHKKTLPLCYNKTSLPWSRVSYYY